MPPAAASQVCPWNITVHRKLSSAAVAGYLIEDQQLHCGLLLSDCRRWQWQIDKLVYESHR
jgi:hypothetical protein